MTPDWTKEFPGAITVCDTEGRITFMNDRSKEISPTAERRSSVKTSCIATPSPPWTKLAGQLASGRPNVYTIEKRGKKKLIFRLPGSATALSGSSSSR